MRSVCLVVMWAGMVSASAAGRPDGWGALQFLVGNWVGEGGGDPGQGSGAFSFKPDLQGRILVRKNRAEYPATKEHAATVHDDLMVVYRDTLAAPMRAIYFDNEGHTIRYDVQTPPDGGDLVFVSAPDAGTPQFRLTYTHVDEAHLKIKFEIAPPGHAGQFAPYLEAHAHRAPN